MYTIISYGELYDKDKADIILRTIRCTVVIGKVKENVIYSYVTMYLYM